MARKKSLGLIKRSKKAVSKAATRHKGYTRAREVKTELSVGRSVQGDYTALLCLLPKQRRSPLAYEARLRRDARNCGAGRGKTPTKAIGDAAREFARSINRRK